MTEEEAEKKAQDAFEMGIITYDQIEEYAKHLLKSNNSEK